MHVSARNKQASVFDVEPHARINPGSPRVEIAQRGGASQVIISLPKRLQRERRRRRARERAGVDGARGFTGLMNGNQPLQQQLAPRFRGLMSLSEGK